MAIYPYFCEECGKEEEVVQSITSYCSAPIRPQCCRGDMTRKITPVMYSVDMPNWGGVVSPIDGTMLDSKTKHREHMQKHGVVLYDDLVPDAERDLKERLKENKKQLKEDLSKVYDIGASVPVYKAPPIESMDNIIPKAA